MRSPAWLMTWWRHYGEPAGWALRVGLFQADGQFVAIAPMCVRRVWHSPGIPMNRLTFLGADLDGRRGSIEVSGFTRPGNPNDTYTEDGKIKEAAFTDAKMAKFKIMGGTVYFVVFKNTGLFEGDTFNTGLANFDGRFETGRSHRDTMSPGIDRKAKYLYLYQIVNDRSLDSRVTQVAGAKSNEGIINPLFAPNETKLPVTEDIANFSLKLLVDPRYITSWGHFHDAGFAAEVPDIDTTGKVIRNVVDDGKGNKGLAFSHAPAIVSKLLENNLQQPGPCLSARRSSDGPGCQEQHAQFGIYRDS